MKKILVVVDMQNDFIDGPLGSPEAVGIVDNVCEVINTGKWNEILVTKDTHYINRYDNSQEGQKLPIKHCIRNSAGWELNDNVFKTIDDLYLKEGKDIEVFFKSTFGCEDLVWYIANNYIEDKFSPNDIEVTFIGVCTDICVISNALLLKAHYPEMKIVVDASCCAGTTPEKHRMALEVMKSCQVDVENEKTVDDDLAYIQDMLDKCKQ